MKIRIFVWFKMFEKYKILVAETETVRQTGKNILSRRKGRTLFRKVFSPIQSPPGTYRIGWLSSQHHSAPPNQLFLGVWLSLVCKAAPLWMNGRSFEWLASSFLQLLSNKITCSLSLSRALFYTKIIASVPYFRNCWEKRNNRNIEIWKKKRKNKNKHTHTHINIWFIRRSFWISYKQTLKISYFLLPPQAPQ